jgi:hypothetical protein
VGRAGPATAAQQIAQRRAARSGGRREPTIRADALVLAYYAWNDRRETRSLMRINRPLVW